MKLGTLLFELLSEALGLNSTYLSDIDCDLGGASKFFMKTRGLILSQMTNSRVLNTVLANTVGPRVSLASLFSTVFHPTSRTYGPIKEILSEENPAKYKNFQFQNFQPTTEQNSERAKDLKAFDDTKLGVRRLVDAGITNIPRIFYHPPHNFKRASDLGHKDYPFPVIDFASIHEERKRFQLLGRTLSSATLLLMPLNQNTCHLYAVEYLLASFVCREILLDYSNQVMKLGTLLFELLSSWFEFNLVDMVAMWNYLLFGHYYPSCPEPELTLGTIKHADIDFITVLLQDHIVGLQVLHQDTWIDVTPVPGALVVNIGGFLHLISNDKFKSAQHRVLANTEEFTSHYRTKCMNGTSPLLHFKI
ncbi:Deacetoxyvindoline 4-hydroxylase, partial [Mucuna pruriens]